MHRVRSLARFGLLLVLAASVAACGGSSGASLNKVEGKVMLNGQPLPKATVTFHPKTKADINFIRPTGMTKDDGTFTLTTGKDDGAPAGQYVVTIICSEDPSAGKKVFSTGGVDTVDRLKGAYADSTRSQISVEVKSGPNTLEPFNLK